MWVKLSEYRGGVNFLGTGVGKTFRVQGWGKLSGTWDGVTFRVLGWRNLLGPWRGENFFVGRDWGKLHVGRGLGQFSVVREDFLQSKLSLIFCMYEINALSQKADFGRCQTSANILFPFHRRMTELHV